MHNRFPNNSASAEGPDENLLAAASSSDDVIEWEGDAGDNEINANQTKAQNDRIHGHGGKDTLRGYDGDDTLDGGAGIDKMYGGHGDDTYHVDHLGDQVTELDTDTGTDTVIVSSAWVLRSSNIEVLAASDSLIDGKPRNINLVVRTPQDDSQTLIGNGGDNLIDGGTGTDILRGRKGNDTYVIRDARVVIEELADEGTDRIESYVNFTLGAGVHVEVLELAAAEVAGTDLTGNELANKLIGNSHDNRLDGGGGQDTLAGGYGNDTYIIDDARDALEETAGYGKDTAITSVDYTLGAGVHVEILAAAAGQAHLALTGSELNNTIIGNDGNNTLTGGAGADTLDGGGGIDWSDYSSAAGPVIVDLLSGKGSLGEAEGDVYSSIENVLGSQGADRLSGDAGDNVLLGENGDDTLDGRAGADRLDGGRGNDTYFVESAFDRVVEAASGGSDTVMTEVSYGLSSFVENLVASGAGAIALMGNELHNVIVGNQAVNVLKGGKGNDKLDGGLGRDKLYGGAGKDCFVFKDALSRKENVDRIADFKATDDTIRLDNAIFKKLGKPGKLKKDFFVIGSHAQDRNDYLIYKEKTGELLYDADGSGRGKAVLFAKLMGAPAITVDDFRII